MAMRKRIIVFIVCLLMGGVFTFNVIAHPNRLSEWQGFTLTSRYSPADTYKSPRTRAIQTILALNTDSTAYQNIHIDGSFGPITHSEVKRYQENEGLNNNGKVGANTWGHLYGELADGSYSPGHYWYYLSTGLGGGDDPEETIIRRGDSSGKWQVSNFQTNHWDDFEFAY